MNGRWVAVILTIRFNNDDNNDDNNDENRLKQEDDLS